MQRVKANHQVTLTDLQVSGPKVGDVVEVEYCMQWHAATVVKTGETLPGYHVRPDGMIERYDRHLFEVAAPFSNLPTLAIYVDCEGKTWRRVSADAH